jgi:hypothetical protein
MKETISNKLQKAYNKELGMQRTIENLITHLYSEIESYVSELRIQSQLHTQEVYDIRYDIVDITSYIDSKKQMLKEIDDETGADNEQPEA